MTRPSSRAPSSSRAGSAAGFSFVEILVVMGIIAVLAGLGVLVVNIFASKSPKIQTQNLLQRVRATAEHWHSRFHAYPPSDGTKIGLVTQSAFSVQKAPNLTNFGIESLYLALHVPGFDRSADFKDDELENNDDDRLEKAFAPTLSSLELFEVKDAWGNPLVYFHNADYVEAEKNPPTYFVGDKESSSPVRPKPWRSEKTGAFEQARSFQLYSMGEDGEPNTEDDVKAW